MQSLPLQQRNTFQAILHYGALLGLFWMFKYLFKIGEIYWKHFIYFYTVLQIATPLLMYFFYQTYVKSRPDLKHTFFRCVLFVVGVGFCASLFEDVMIFAHYAFFDSSMLYHMLQQMTEIFNTQQLEKFYPSYSSEQIENIRETYLRLLNPKMILGAFVISNTILQSILSLIFGLFIGFFASRTINHLNK